MKKNVRKKNAAFVSEGGGEAGARFRSIDWKNHPMGDPSEWPEPLTVTLRTVFHSRHPMYIWWGRDCYQFYNDAYFPSFGHTKLPQVMGQKGATTWPQTWHFLWPNIEKILNGSASIWNEDELIPIFRNGRMEDAYWTFSLNPIHLEDGSVGGVLTVCTETTSKVTTQKQLAKAMSVAKIGFYDWDLKNNVVHFSDQMQGEWKFTPRVSFEEAFQRIHIEDRAEVLLAIEDAIQNHKTYEAIYRVNRPDSGLAWAHTLGEVSYDQSHQPERIFGTTVDITNQKSNEVMVQKVLDNLPIYANLLTPDGRILLVNETAVGILNPSGQDYSDLFIWELDNFCQNVDTQKTLRQAVEQAAGGEPMRFDLLHNAFIGGKKVPRWIDVQIKPIFNELGEVTSLLKTGFDITERLMREKQLAEARSMAEQANESKSTFLANMSHEIRTPLGAIMGFADLIGAPHIEKDEINNYVSVIKRNSSQLLRIIDDILDLSKVEAGRMEIERLRFSLPGLLAEIASFLGLRARERGIVFEVKAESLLPDIIYSDPTRIKQILINAVGNAIKFTERGKVELLVSMDNSVLKMLVRDTGRGISEEQEKKLFQPFTQADSSTSREFGGTGLGLVLTRRLCRAMGGDYQLISSEMHRGSTFCATIKVDVATEASFVEDINFSFTTQDTEFQSEGKALDGMKVLLVEDSPDNQELVKVMLSKAGAQVDIAGDGEEGLLRAFKGSYEAILMDVQMPKLDGIEATHILRQNNMNLPIIALTAHAMKDQRDRILKEGFTHFLAKPVQRKPLIDLLKSLH